MQVSRVWLAICGFEVRFHLRQPLFYLATFVLGVLLFLAGTGHRTGVATGRLHLNAPIVILELLGEGIFFVLFLVAAFVASAALRDDEQRTAALFLSKPVPRWCLLTARFAGAISVCMLAYLAGAVALGASSLMPWVDPSRLGPFRLAPLAFGLGVLVFPTLFALGSMLFAIAGRTGSTLATCFGVVLCFVVSAAGGIAASYPRTAWVGQLLDPFGVVALSGALQYWTAAESNAALPGFTGLLLWNRILWLGLGCLALGLFVARHAPTRSRRRRRVWP